MIAGTIKPKRSDLERQPWDRLPALMRQANERRKNMIIKANEIKVGTQLAEADGFLFDVVEIVKETHKTITVRLCSDFSSIPAHWTIKPDGTPGGVLKTFRKSTKLYGIA